MSSFTKSIGKWVITVNRWNEAVMYEFGKRGDFCAGPIVNVIGVWLRNSAPDHRLVKITSLLHCNSNSSMKDALQSARAKASSDHRGAARLLILVSGIDWDDERASEECEKMDALLLAKEKMIKK